MPDVPDAIVLKRDRDLEGRGHDIWIRRAIFGLVVAVPIIALFNVFGQRPDTHMLVGPAASLKIYAPARLRGGLLYEARFHITARQDIKDAYLVLGPGWAEGMSINTIEPSPVSEASNSGRLSFELGHIGAGKSYIQFMQFQVNPTNVAWNRKQTVWLNDGKERLLTFSRGVTIFP
jgi:hypothetical protein